MRFSESFFLASTLLACTPEYSTPKSLECSQADKNYSSAVTHSPEETNDSILLTPRATAEVQSPSPEIQSSEINYALKRFKKFGLQPDQIALIVIPNQQQLVIIRNDKKIGSFLVSTALRGTGNKKDGNQTPTGMHTIFSKRGEHAKIGTELGGQVRGMITRKMTLAGLEARVNRGGYIDSLYRGIAIHGTPSEKKIGTPASHGCIRMTSKNVIALFDMLPTGTLVEILPHTTLTHKIRSAKHKKPHHR